MLLLRRRSAVKLIVSSRATYIVVGVLGFLGNAFIYIAFTDYYGLFWRVFPVAGICMGLAVSLLLVLWGRAVSRLDEKDVELSVMCAFALSFALYFVLLLTKVAAELFAFAMAFVLIGTIVLAYQCSRDCAQTTCEECVMCVVEPDLAGVGDEMRGAEEPLPARNLLSFSMIALFLWLQIAFFRVISSPATMGDRFAHYLVPFGFACVISLALVVLCVRFSRSLNITHAFRWSLPFFVASYIPIIVAYDEPAVRIVAYAINFIGMFGVQFGVWMSACKQIQRCKLNPFRLLGGYLIGEGVGIFAGCAVALYLMFNADLMTILVVGLALITVLVFGVMSFGFDPYWVATRSNDQAVAQMSRASVPHVDDAPDESSIDAMFLLAALNLKDEFGLTAREVDVAALLAAGRSRTYIRDRLMISINTVGSHSRNIFSKCGVHSQQELMSLARDRMS